MLALHEIVPVIQSKTRLFSLDTPAPLTHQMVEQKLVVSFQTPPTAVAASPDKKISKNAENRKTKSPPL